MPNFQVEISGSEIVQIVAKYVREKYNLPENVDLKLESTNLSTAQMVLTAVEGPRLPEPRPFGDD